MYNIATLKMASYHDTILTLSPLKRAVVEILANSRFHIAFMVSSVCGWGAGILLEDGFPVLENQEKGIILSLVFLGGFSARLFMADC